MPPAHKNAKVSLEDRVFACLKGSTAKIPVEIEQLRKLTDDQGALDRLLDQLILGHIVNHIGGMKECKPHHVYWLTGAVRPPLPFVPPPSEPVHPVQTSALKQSSKKRQPNAPKITKGHSPSELRIRMLALIRETPNILKPVLIKAALAKVPDATNKQANDVLSNLRFAGLIEKTGHADKSAYSVKPEATQPSSTKKVSKHTNADPMPSRQPRLHYQFNLGGSFIITKNRKTILFTSDEAQDLMQFAAQQLAMINQPNGDNT